MDGIGNATDIRVRLCIWNDHHFFGGGEFFQYIGDTSKGIEFLFLKGIPVCREQHLRLNLTKSIQHPLNAKIR